MQIRNQLTLCLTEILNRLRRALPKGVAFILNPRLIIISFLICLVSFCACLSVFSQTLTDETLDILKEQTDLSTKEDKDKSVLIERPDIKYNAAKSRDPFKPQLSIYGEEVKAEEPTGPIKLKASELFSLSVQGIIWNSDNPLVIINNRVLKKGEVLLIPKDKIVEKVTITDIDKDGVTINYLGVVEKLRSPATSKLQKTKGGKK